MKTLFYIDDCMAMCHAVRCREITESEAPPHCMNGPKRRRFAWRPPRKRKDRHTSTSLSSAILLECDAPFRADTEQRIGTMHGNACFNFIGDADVIREQLAHLPEQIRGRVLVWTTGAEEPEVLWPEIEIGHAVVDRHKATALASAIPPDTERRRPMKLSLEIETANAAFEDPSELGRILRELSGHLDSLGWRGLIGGDGGKLFDVNGNACGTWDMAN